MQIEQSLQGLAIKLNGYADAHVFEQIPAFNPDDLSALDSGELSFFFRQGGCAREIDFDVVAGPDGCSYG